MRESNVPPAGLVIVRVACGWIALWAGWRWWQGGMLDGREMRLMLRAALEHRGWFGRWWGETVLLTNPEAVVFLWKSMAVVAGLSFLFGALVRPVGTLGVFFLVQAAAYGPEGSERIAMLLAACFLGCAISHAGRGFGLDVLLDSSLPPWMTWTKDRRRSLF